MIKRLEGDNFCKVIVHEWESVFYVLGHLAELKKNIEIRIERCKIVLDDFKRLIRESRLSRFIAR